MSSGSRGKMVDEQVCEIPEEYQNSHVLLVDHDRETIEFMTTSLQHHRYQVASTGLAGIGLKMVLDPKSIFDIVIASTDMLSLMNHLDFVRQITLHKPHVPVILMSKNDSQSIADEAIIAGAASFMWKPCQSKDLRDIWHHIDRRKKAPIGRINNRSLDGQDCSRNKEISRPLMIDGSPPQRNYKHRESGRRNEKKSQERNNSLDARNVVIPIEENHKESSSSSSLPWTADMRAKFLRILEELGENASPQEVLDRMNISDETWDNVGNHLQKYAFPMTTESAHDGNNRSGNESTLPRLENSANVQVQPQQTTTRVTADLAPQALPLTSQAELIPPGEHSIVPGPMIPSPASMTNVVNRSFVTHDIIMDCLKRDENNSSSIIPSPSNNHIARVDSHKKGKAPLIEDMVIEESIFPVDSREKGKAPLIEDMVIEEPIFPVDSREKGKAPLIEDMVIEEPISLIDIREKGKAPLIEDMVMDEPISLIDIREKDKAPLIEDMVIEEPISQVDFNSILNPQTADLDAVMVGSGNMGNGFSYEIPHENKKLVKEVGEEPSSPLYMESMLNLSVPDLDDLDLGIFSGLDDVQENFVVPGFHNPSSLTMANSMNVMSHLGTSGGDIPSFSHNLDDMVNNMLPHQDDYPLINEDDIFFF